MKNFVMIQIVMIAIFAVGDTERPNVDVAKFPIQCWIDSIMFSQDVEEVGHGASKTTMGTGTTYTQTDSNKEQTKKSFGVGVEVEATGGASASTSGPATANVGVKGTAKGDAGYRKIKVQDSSTDLVNKNDSRDETVSAAEFNKGDYQLRLFLNIRNTSPNQFKYEPGTTSGLSLKIEGQPVLIPLPAPDLDLIEPGASYSVQIKTSVTEENAREALKDLQRKNKLKGQVMLRTDSGFRFQDLSKGADGVYVCASDTDYSVVVMIDFDLKDDLRSKFPVFMRTGISATCREVLELASSELPKDFQFKFTDFTDSGLLSKVVGRDFGQFTSNDKGNVCAILARVDGEIKGSLRGDETFSDRHTKNRLNFVEMGVAEMYNRFGLIRDTSLVSNCLSYIEETLDSNRKISAMDLYNGACLAEKIGDYTKVVRFLACMDKKERDRLCADDEKHNKGQFIESAIKGDDVESFKALRYLGWGNANRTMLGYAAECGSLKVVKWLIEGDRKEVDEVIVEKSPGDVGKTPLYFAAENGHLDVCKYLVSRKADINFMFYEREKDGETKECDMLVDENSIPLRTRNYIAAERAVLKVNNRWLKWCGRKPSNVTSEVISEWINAGVSPKSYLGGDWNLLSWAIELRDINLVERLIDEGADVNDNYSIPPTDGYTALMFACKEGRTNLVAKIISKGADLYAKQDNGMGAFYYAIMCKKYECADMLLDNNLDITICSLVEVNGEELNPYQFVGTYCANSNLITKVEQSNRENYIMISGLQDRAGAGAGDPDALNELGIRYANGEGVVMNKCKAFELFSQSATQGCVKAWHNLSRCYKRGIGCEPDAKEAKNCEQEAKIREKNL